MGCHTATLAQEARLTELDDASRVRRLDDVETAELDRLSALRKQRIRNARRKVRLGRPEIEKLRRQVDRIERQLAGTRILLTQMEEAIPA